MIRITNSPVTYTGAGFAPAAGSEGRDRTMAYSILKAHNTAPDMDRLKIRFDAMASHDITYVGIIQTARASGMTEFPVPYVLTTATTPCAPWAVPSTRMTTFLACPPPKSTVVSLFPPTRPSSTPTCGSGMPPPAG